MNASSCKLLGAYEPTQRANQRRAINHEIENMLSVFLSSYRNTYGSLEEQELLCEHEPQASVSTAFSSPPKLSRVFL